MQTKKMMSLYYRELGGAFVIYAVLLIASIEFGRPMNDGLLRTFVLASPMAGFGLAVWAIARHVRRLDEYMRRNMLETLALTAALTAGLTFTYGFLETAGYPRLSMFAVWPVMCGVWGAINGVRALLQR